MSYFLFYNIKSAFSHQTWNVSHRNYLCAFTTSYTVSHYPVYPGITKVTSSIDAKTELHEGRNMASVDAQVQTGCRNKRDKVVLRLRILLKMNEVQLILLNYSFFQQCYILRRVNIFLLRYFVVMATNQT